MVVESRSVIRNAKNAPSPPFPSRARLILALLVLIRSNSESLAQANGFLNPLIILTVGFESNLNNNAVCKKEK